ncbi:glutathione S-transferase T3-like [Salvia hispanica]|uniref:glutathione S-transferase T3-like n=1 Tax=Salvia hispanica TaxID=49212 RepID=UPI0020094BE8|nr:glutathione S-transferase T3-like [Salvia hispanica]
MNKSGHQVEEDLGRHPYSSKETLALYTSWLTVSYDPIVGNQQNKLCFWQKVTELYTDSKPRGSHPRTVKMLRSHWDRVDKDVKKFCAVYRGEAEHYQSGASEADILRAAMRVFKDDVKKDFKHIDVWQLVRNEDRWAGGVQSSSSKRTKHTGVATRLVRAADQATPHMRLKPVAPPPVHDVGRKGPRRRRRLEGEGRGRGRVEANRASAGAGMGSNTSLWFVYMLSMMADTSKMTPTQYEHHVLGMQAMARQLGLQPGAPPPASGDDSPAE